MGKKILVILGHPNNSSLCAALAAAYIEGTTAADSEVRVHRIGDMQFDNSLHMGFGAKQALEPDLERFQGDLKWSEHIVMVFPLWWGTMPGPMKGLIDRTFLPGVTFKYKEGSPFQDKLLAGRSGRVVMTMDSPNFWYKLILGRPLTKALKRQILGFCGIKPLKFTYFGNVRGSKPEGRAAWIEQMRALGKAGA